MAGTWLVGAIIILALFVAFEAIRSLRPAFVGRAAPVDWWRGLIALPRRYLVDVHDIVARRPAASRMHAPLAGGLLAAAGLLVLGLVPALRASSIYWAIVALAFAGGGFVVTLDAALGRPLPLPASLLFTFVAFGGGLWLVRQIAAGPMRHAMAGALHLVV